jgi:hypothetical protein
MRKMPPAPPKGTRHPGAGRARGTPNRISVEAKLLASQLVMDAAYQHRLRKDFRTRRIHPTIESLVWQYHLGKPSQPVEISGGLALDVQARLDEERRAFSMLDLADLEQLAAESQALVDRAFALSKLSGHRMIEESERAETPMKGADLTCASDKGSYVNPEPPDEPNS